MPPAATSTAGPQPQPGVCRRPASNPACWASPRQEPRTSKSSVRCAFHCACARPGHAALRPAAVACGARAWRGSGVLTEAGTAWPRSGSPRSMAWPRSVSCLGHADARGDAVSTVPDDRDHLLQADLSKPAPQPHDVGPDLGVGEPRVLPGEGRELFARERTAGVAKKEVEEVGLAPGQPQRFARVGKGVVLAVDHDPRQLGVAVSPSRETLSDPLQVARPLPG